MIIDWQKIDTVMFDMDGTLLDLHYDNYFWQTHLPAVYAKKNNMPLDDAKQYLQPIFEEKQGQLEWYCIDYWSRQLSMDIAKEKTNKEIVRKIRFRNGAEEFLKRLRKKGLKVWLLTNAHPTVIQIKSELLISLDQYFDVKISSHELGFAKEQQEFWHLLMQQKPFNLENTLFIDDSLSVLLSAQKFGIKNLLGISQPDSQTKLVDHTEFTLIDNFDELALNCLD